MPKWLKKLLGHHLLMFLLQIPVAIGGWLYYFFMGSHLGVFLFLFYSFFAAFNLSNIFSCSKETPCDACKALNSNL